MTLRAVKFPAIDEADACAASLSARRSPQSIESRATPSPPMMGFEEGFEAGARAKAQELDAALAAIERVRLEISDQMAQLEVQYRKQCAAALAEIINAAAPAISEAAANSAIASIFDDAAGAAPRVDLTLRASSDVFDAIRTAREIEPPAGIELDPDLAPGTLHARWRGGELECDVGRSLFAIVEFLNSQSGRPL